jgi:GAF domain-containing protein
MTETGEHALATRMAELARTVAAPRAIEDIFREVTATAVQVIPGVDTAGVLVVVKGGRFESHAGTTDVPYELDRLQQLLQEGPCLDAAVDDVVITVEDFRTEQRWPAYSAAVADIGVLSGLSFRLYTADRTAGALNLFGFEPVRWSDDAITVGTVLAAHAAAAIIASTQHGQLSSALMSRDRIGQAKGIIMERYGVDAVRAFDMLRRLSQESNTPVFDIAERIIDSR